MSARILFVDDEPSIRKVVAAQLARDGHDVVLAEDGDAAVAALTASPVDLVLTDLRMPGLDGMGLLRWIETTQPRLPVVVLTAHGTVDVAVEAMRHGAFDFLSKPFDQDELRAVVAKALSTRAHAARSASTDDALALLGDGSGAQAIRDVVARVAPTSAPILVQGEPGTGKESVARAIHAASGRTGPLAVVHVAALDPADVAAELFGVANGPRPRPGRVALATGGTLVLHEVEALPLPCQVRLLGLLQDSTYEPEGGGTTRADVRLVATTADDLATAVAQGRMRQDLHYRLAVVPIRVPPLRVRLADLPRLCDALLTRARALLDTPAVALTDEALAHLATHGWPGNVRELETVLTRAALLADGPILDVDDLVAFHPAPAGASARPAAVAHVDEALDLKAWVHEHVVALERQRIVRALAQHEGNVTHASRSLGISRRSLQTKMKDYGLRED